MATRRYNADANVSERKAAQRAGNRQQAPTASTMRRISRNLRRRRSNGGNGG